jgi:archaellum component FlaF (FlaF/FlaG flagellin family)
MTVAAYRSLRLIPKTDFSRLAGNRGELFYDPVNNTLRVFNGQTLGGEIIATRTWVNTAVAAIGSSNLVNGARTVSLSSAGTLTIPGDIRSEGNINIDINLSDSTLRRWQFGEDGDTVFPNNVSINYGGGGNIQFPRIIADSGKAFSIQGQGNSGSAALAWTVNPDAASQYAAVSVSRAGGDNLAKVVLQAQSNSGDAGTVKTWKFNETGNLTFPSGTLSIENNMFDTITSTDVLSLQGNSIVLSGGLTNGSFPTLSQINLLSDGNVVVNSDGKDWYFTPDGALTIPGDIKSNGNINLEINLADSTLRRWQFGEDGALTFPNGTNQITAWTGIPGPYADDEAATLAGVALGSPYHKTGTGGQVFVRLTSPS